MYFVKNSYLDDLLDSNVYFLIGEKGTGKTAYANGVKVTGNHTDESVVLCRKVKLLFKILDFIW